MRPQLRQRPVQQRVWHRHRRQREYLGGDQTQTVVQEFNSSGSWLMSFGSAGTGNGQFTSSPYGITTGAKKWWRIFVGLIYQIYSVKVLFMLFAESTYAGATAISSFMAGLACS